MVIHGVSGYDTVHGQGDFADHYVKDFAMERLFWISRMPTVIPRICLRGGRRGTARDVGADPKPGPCDF